MQIIYLLEENIFFRHDYDDNENVEERHLLGFFTDIDQLVNSINSCVKNGKNNGINKKHLFVSSYWLNINSNQKYIYVLSHEYYKIVDGEYVDYYYIFEPLTSRKKCIELKESLKNDEKYKFSPDRHYDYQPPDGFFISQFKLNYLYGQPSKNLK